jgi:hypothetical protein
MPRSRHDLHSRIKSDGRRDQRRQKNTCGKRCGLVLAIVCVLSLPGISRAQQVKLKAALQVPVSELFIVQSLAQFKKEVEERTAISIEIFDDGKPYNDAADGAVLLCWPGECRRPSAGDKK